MCFPHVWLLICMLYFKVNGSSTCSHSKLKSFAWAKNSIFNVSVIFGVEYY